MALHQTSGRWRLGLLLALVTAGFWSTLPIALKITLEQLDAWTITWFRFLTAALALLVWALYRNRLGGFRKQPPRVHWMMMAAALLLTGNFVGYLFGLKYTTPANAQLLIQASPLLMALGGILIFRESFAAPQWLGLGLVAIGLIGFALDQSRQTQGIASHYALGVAIVMAASVVWAGYALLQKQLLNHLGSMLLLLFIYSVATLLLLPLAQPSRLLQLDRLHALTLAFCCINTIGAYGAFAEALAHWEASRVGIILALTPIFCVAAVWFCHLLAPDLIAAEHIQWLGWLGAGLVISGSALVSLAQKKTPGD